MKLSQKEEGWECSLKHLTRPMNDGARTPSLIFINGFLQENEDSADDWLAAVNARFAENDKFLWRWPAGSLGRCLNDLQSFSVSESWLSERASSVLEELNKPMSAFMEKFFNCNDGKYIHIIKFTLLLILPMAALYDKGKGARKNDEMPPDPDTRNADASVWSARKILLTLAAVMAGMGMVGVLWGLFNFLKTWHEAREDAEKAGVELADQLVRRAEAHQETFILMGHSLGARVARACVHELHRRNRSHIVQDVYLLSGAVASGPWEEVAGSISGRIYNFYAPGDLVVGPLYKASGCWEETIGIAEIPDTGTNNVENHNVVDILEKCQGEGTQKFIHMRYKHAFGDMLADCVS